MMTDRDLATHVRFQPHAWTVRVSRGDRMGIGRTKIRPSVVLIALVLAIAGCASRAPSTSVGPTPMNAASPTSQGDDPCACSTHPPTAPPGAISKDAAIAAALRVNPGAGAKTRVVWVQVASDPFVRHDIPAGGTPLPESFRLVWMVRLQGDGLTSRSCPADTLPTTPAAASEGPCLDSEGGVDVLLDPMTGALLGWTH
jgi:hypothetical protein